jgi:hypothetical protein
MTANGPKSSAVYDRLRSASEWNAHRLKPCESGMQMATVKKSCERLMHEKDMLVQYGSALAARLASFDQLEALSADFAAAQPAPNADAALALLARVDDCLAYMASNPQYADTMAYSLRLRQLQARTAS